MSMKRRDTKVTPITRHEPRTFFPTRVTQAMSAEVWDLWTVQEGRRVGTLTVVDDGQVLYGQATVRKGTDHEELTDLMDCLYPPNCTEATRQELLIVDYEEEPKVYDMALE